MTIQELREKRAKAWDTARDFLDSKRQADGTLSEEDSKTYDVLYCCSASRPATEGETTEESKSVKTEKLSLKASALPNGLVKSKTCESTDETTYNNWYNAVYMPTAATNNSTGTRSAGTTKSGSATE